ncbi:MAG: hypothetical protein ABIT05_08640 [Chitinophagaceae bacterium]
MPRMSIIFCSGVFLLSVTALPAQVLPKKPTMQQVVGYHQWQEQAWRNRQLPLNSVLYRNDQKNFNWEKQWASSWQSSQPVITLRQYIPLNLANKLDNIYVGVVIEKQPVHWHDTNWWKDQNNAPGAALLRAILVHNRVIY